MICCTYLFDQSGYLGKPDDNDKLPRLIAAMSARIVLEILTTQGIAFFLLAIFNQDGH